MEKRYSLIIFDWDGTLIDSVPTIVSALKFAAGKMDLPRLNDEAYKGVIGLSLVNAVQSLYKDLDCDAVQRYIKFYRDQYNHLEESPSAPFSGVSSGLEALRKRGVMMAVATGKGRKGLERSMKANEYHKYFQASRCAEEARSKPDSLMLEQLLHELSVPVDQALMVGDAGFDLKMAENLQMDRVAVTYGAQSREQLQDYNSLYIADSFDDLMTWLIPN